MKHPHEIIIIIHHSYPLWSAEHIAEFAVAFAVGCFAAGINILMYRRNHRD